MDEINEEERRRIIRDSVSNGESSSLSQHPTHDSAGLNRCPHAYFDLIAGTGTGGLIAIMLGRLHMSVGDCLAVYERLGGEVYGHPRRWHRNKFSDTRLERAIKEIVRDHSPADYSPDLFPQPQNGRRECRTAVLAIRREQRGDVTYLFRTYDHRQTVQWRDFHLAANEFNPGKAEKVYIWQAARATTATPFYFTDIGIEGSRYVDGGVQENNPCLIVWNEARLMHRDRPDDQRYCCPPNAESHSYIGAFLSIGSGVSHHRSRFGEGIKGRLLQLGRSDIRRGLTDPEPRHREIEEILRAKEVPYFRLNVTTGLEHVQLDAWRVKRGKREDQRDELKTLNHIRAETTRYLNLQATRETLIRLAERLVDYQHQRAAAPPLPVSPVRHQTWPPLSSQQFTQPLAQPPFELARYRSPAELGT